MEHNDESHVSAESSSSALPNQKLDDLEDEDDFFTRDSLGTAPLLDEPLRKNPSIALPITCGSTNELLLSQRNLLFGFFVSLRLSSLSLNRSKTSFENETDAVLVFVDFFRAIG